MIKTNVPVFKFLVAGDPNNAKANFIDGFLENNPPSAHIRRVSGSIYSVNRPCHDFNLQLHDVNGLETLRQGCLLDMDAVFFCFAVNDPESLQKLEKWIKLMRDENEEKLFFLVADTSNLGIQQNVADLLIEKAKKLKDEFKIQWLIEGAFDNKESTSSVYKNILNTISIPLSSKYRETNKGQVPEILAKNSARLLPWLLRKPNLDEEALRSLLNCEKGIGSLSLCKGPNQLLNPF